MEAGDDLTAGHWVSADDAPMVGQNDGQLLWINDDRIPYLSVRHDDPDILAFDLMGHECPEPLAFCCVEMGSTIECDWRRPWLCPGAAPSGRGVVTVIPPDAIICFANNRVKPKPKKNPCTTEGVPTCGGSGGVVYESMAACEDAVVRELGTTACTASGALCIPCIQDFDEDNEIIYYMGTEAKCKLKQGKTCPDDQICAPKHVAPAFGPCLCVCHEKPS